MPQNKKILFLIVLISAIGGGLAERAITDRWRQEETTKEEEKTKNNIITIIKEKKNKDGSEEKETTIVDKSKSERRQEQHSELSINVAPKDWFVYGGLNTQGIYMVGLQRRILGPIHVGGYADTSRTVGVSVGISF